MARVLLCLEVLESQICITMNIYLSNLFCLQSIEVLILKVTFIYQFHLTSIYAHLG